MRAGRGAAHRGGLAPAWRVARPLALLLLVVPGAEAAQHAHPDGDDAAVAEALFLPDTLPPGGRDLNASVLVERRDPDPATGERALAASPRLQVGAPLGSRLGFTADVGFSAGGPETAGASLKVLLRRPRAGEAGYSASVDLYGSAHPSPDPQAAVAVGALRAIGPATLRAAALAATGLSRWSPRLQAGASAALAVSARWRLLAELVAERGEDGTTLAAGPTVKVALGERLALAAGALFDVRAASAPMVALQLTTSL